MKNWLIHRVVGLWLHFIKVTVSVVPDDRFGGGRLVMESPYRTSTESLGMTLEDIRRLWHKTLELKSDTSLEVITNAGGRLMVPGPLVQQLRTACRMHLFANYHQLSAELDKN